MAKYHDHYERVTWANGVTALSAEHMNNIEDGIEDLIEYKVEKETGKGLYPDTDKTKLAGIEAGAQVNRTYTAVTGKPTAAASPGFGGTFTVSQVVQSSTGQVSVTDRVITIPSTDATTSAHGLMTAADKTKLNGIATGAEVNQNAFSNVKVGSTTVAADGKTDTLELVAGSNVTLTPDATNDKVTIAATVPTVPTFVTKSAYLKNDTYVSANGSNWLEFSLSGITASKIIGIKGIELSASGSRYAGVCIGTISIQGSVAEVSVKNLTSENITFTKADTCMKLTCLV